MGHDDLLLPGHHRWMHRTLMMIPDVRILGLTELRQAGKGLPFVSSPRGRSSKPTMKAKAVRATGVPRV